MFPKIRDLALPLALSALFAGAFGAEFVLQNGVNDYKGCEDASLLSHTCWLSLNEEHFKDEYGADGTVMGGLENNYDHVPYLFVNFCPSWGDVYAHSVIKFELPKSISQRASVESAKLEVKLAGGMMYSYVPENRLILYPITQKWKESEVSYNNASKDNGWEGYSFMGYLGATMVSAPIDTDMRVVSSDNEDVGSWVEFDVTDIVNKMIKNPDKYDGFIFAEGLVKNGDDLTSEGEHVYDTANSYNNQRYFFSSEHESVDDRPKLTINADVGVLNLGDIAAEKFAVTVNNNSVQLTNETQGDLSFALYDVRGRLVFTTELVKAGKVVTFTLPQTARGVYTLQAIGRESNFTKLIKL